MYTIKIRYAFVIFMFVVALIVFSFWVVNNKNKNNNNIVNMPVAATYNVAELNNFDNKINNDDRLQYYSHFDSGEMGYPGRETTLTVTDSNGKVVKIFSGSNAITNAQGFTNDQKYFYKCSSSGEMNNANFEVYTVSNFSLAYKYIQDNPSEKMYCHKHVDAESNTFEYTIKDDQTLSVDVYQYVFDTNTVNLLSHLPVKSKYSNVAREVAFDGCGKFEHYKDEKWYQKIDRYRRSAEGPMMQIAEVCQSLDKSLVIFLEEGSYCTPGSIFQFDVSKSTFSKASFGDYERCVAWPKEFGKRKGQIIPLQGFSGDAGSHVTMYYDYDYIENKIKLKKRCQRSEGEKQESCFIEKEK